MSKHTPGPWKVRIEKSKDGFPNYKITSCDKTEVYAACNSVGYSTTANAHLIAAAPDLLEALEHVQATLEFKRLYPGTTNMVLAAIAKAKGDLHG